MPVFRASIWNVAILCLAAYLLGGVLTFYRYFPYGWVERAFLAEKAYRLQGHFGVFARKIVHISPRDITPVSHWQQDAAFNGTTLYTLAGKTSAVLVDMEGKELHRWNFSLDAPEVHKRWLPHWRDAHAYPNGDLLVVAENMALTPYAQSLSRYDKNGKLLWQDTAGSHHAVSVLANGNILTLCQKLVTAQEIASITKLRVGPEGFLDDSVCLYKPDGTPIKQVSLFRALMKGARVKWLDTSKTAWDPVHANSVQMLDAETARHFPLFREGQVLVSLRSSSMIAVIDLERESAVWAAQGTWHMQHSAKFGRGGKIILFDNKGISKRSRILAVDPETRTATSLYGEGEDEAFISTSLGSVSELPNGNLLIESSAQGRIIEVDAKGTPVWDFTAPYSYADGTQVFVTAVHRYREGYFDDAFWK